MGLPELGRDADEILDELRGRRTGDVRWDQGRTFGLVFDGGPEVRHVAEEAARLYLHDNALNTRAFPSLGAIQADVVGWTAELLHGPETAAGFLTSGGTESILCAVKAARERGRVERGVTRPNLVLATSAHAAFHKAAHLFGLEARTVDVGPDWRADPTATAAVCDEQTVLVVASAPQYPQGVIDPVPELAALAAEVGASCHVDACMGGFVLPFAEQLGRAVPPWDLRVEGVTSISADLHKLGYAPKGASVILHRTRELRRYQTFTFDGWLGGTYASPNLQGTRSGLPMAAAWAVMQSLGLEGYRRLTRTTLETADRLRAGVAAIEGLAVLGAGRWHLVSIAAAPGWGDRLDVFAVGDGLHQRSWHLDRQTPPDNLHATVSAGNAPTLDRFLEDLAATVAEVLRRRNGGGDRGTTYATLE